MRTCSEKKRLAKVFHFPCFPSLRSFFNALFRFYASSANKCVRTKTAAKKRKKRKEKKLPTNLQKRVKVSVLAIRYNSLLLIISESALAAEKIARRCECRGHVCRCVLLSSWRRHADHWTRTKICQMTTTQFIAADISCRLATWSGSSVGNCCWCWWGAFVRMQWTNRKWCRHKGAMQFTMIHCSVILAYSNSALR